MVLEEAWRERGVRGEGAHSSHSLT
ncbi:early nodulin-36B [Glycine max]|nr:early nodulin-36B [Glycine max]|eukprot:NP_001340763.1 early nodulin-36B [Glycine max]